MVASAGQPAARGHPVPEQGEERGDVIGMADQMQIEPLARWPDRQRCRGR